MMKQFVISLLQSRAKAVLKKHQPIIIGVTGSYGKTSAKNAIQAVLSGTKRVRAAEGNFNNEIGVPLTILGFDSPGRSPLSWLRLFWKSYFIKDFPEVLVLEFGADRPGDIERLVSLAPPHIGVLTGVSPVHVENYAGGIEELAAEKGKLLQVLPANGLAVVNADDDRALALSRFTQAEVKEYGERSSDYSIDSIQLIVKEAVQFEVDETYLETVVRISVDGADMGDLRLKNAIGYAPVMACLPALIVANYFGVAFVDAEDRLEKYLVPAPGRLRPIPGIKGSLIIDDSYNASPAAMLNGLKVLRELPLGNESSRRIAVLGKMAELGVDSETEHRKVGEVAANVADLLLLVGEEMRWAEDAAKNAGMNPDAIEWFATSYEAGRYLDGKIQTGDLVYVKGSQSSRMEKVVKDVMAQPTRAGELLARQYGKWLQS